MLYRGRQFSSQTFVLVVDRSLAMESRQNNLQRQLKQTISELEALYVPNTTSSPSVDIFFTQTVVFKDKSHFAFESMHCNDIRLAEDTRILTHSGCYKLQRAVLR